MKVTNLFTEKDREVFDRIDRDCIAMHVPTPPKTFLKLEVVGPDGEPLERYEDRAHSWVRNGLNAAFYRYFGIAGSTPYGAGGLALKRTAGALISNSSSDYLVARGGTGDVKLGIIVGTGDSSESFESFNLDATIAHGTAAGQLSYAADAYTHSYDAVSKKWTIVQSRILNNNSGNDIIVKEVGIMGKNPNSLSYEHLVCRDLLASAVTVPNAGQLTVTYTIEMTYPA